MYRHRPIETAYNSAKVKQQAEQEQHRHVDGYVPDAAAAKTSQRRGALNSIVSAINEVGLLTGVPLQLPPVAAVQSGPHRWLLAAN
jgi:hypothetical protein